MEKPISVLFVCTGNICRSPMAEAVFLHLTKEAGLDDQFEVASAGTGSWHVGEPPHSGTQAILRENNIPIKRDKRARRITAADFASYDYVIAMDHENIEDLTIYGKTVPLLLAFAAPELTASMPSLDVMDPYYNKNFQYTYNQVVEGCRGLLNYIREQHGEQV